MRRHLLVFMSVLWLAGCGSSGRDGIEVGQPGSVDIVDEVSADIESLAHQPVAESHEPAKVPRLTGPVHRPGVERQTSNKPVAVPHPNPQRSPRILIKPAPPVNPTPQAEVRVTGAPAEAPSPQPQNVEVPAPEPEEVVQPAAGEPVKPARVVYVDESTYAEDEYFKPGQVLRKPEPTPAPEPEELVVEEQPPLVVPPDESVDVAVDADHAESIGRRIEVIVRHAVLTALDKRGFSRWVSDGGKLLSKPIIGLGESSRPSNDSFGTDVEDAQGIEFDVIPVLRVRSDKGMEQGFHDGLPSEYDFQAWYSVAPLCLNYQPQQLAEHDIYGDGDGGILSKKMKLVWQLQLVRVVYERSFAKDLKDWLTSGSPEAYARMDQQLSDGEQMIADGKVRNGVFSILRYAQRVRSTDKPSENMETFLAVTGVGEEMRIGDHQSDYDLHFTFYPGHLAEGDGSSTQIEYRLGFPGGKAGETGTRVDHLPEVTQSAERAANFGLCEGL